MKKSDFILIGILLIVSVFLIIFFKGFGKGEFVNVYVDGKLVNKVMLSGVNDEFIIGSKEDGYNVIHVEDGYVWISEADCPGKDCINQGKISRTNESIVCLPHKLCVTIESGDSSEYDFILNQGY